MYDQKALRLIFLIVVIFLFSSLCAKEWTLFIYMASDNGLYQNALEDINQLEEGLQDNMNVLVFIDHPAESNTPGAEILLIKKDETPYIVSNTIKTYGSVNSGDKQTLIDFVSWGLKKYPGDKSALVLWSHGNGWYKNDDVASKYICTDNEFNSAISIADGDLKYALEKIGHHFQLILMDACNMGSLETTGEIYLWTDYFIASQKEVPVQGFPWNDVLNEWNSYPTEEDFFKQIPQIYTDSYFYGGSQNLTGNLYFEVSAFTIKTSEFSALMEQLSEFSNDHALESAQDLYVNARAQCFEFNGILGDVDIKQCFDLIYEKQANKENNPLLNQIDSTVIAVSAINMSVYGYPTIWYPRYADLFESVYSLKYHQLDFSEVGFGRFINYSFGPDDRKPQSVENIKSEHILNTLYISWSKPIDPCPIRYKINVYYLNSLLFSEELQKESFSYTFDSDIQTATITIQSLDEADNISEAVSVSYEKKTDQKFNAFITPNPINNLNFAKIRWIQESDLPKINISIYTISGDLLVQHELKNVEKGEHFINLYDLINSQKKLSTGLYTLLIKANHVNHRIKFAIIN